MSYEYIAGKNPIIEVLKSTRPIHKIWIAEGSQKGQMQQLIKLANKSHVTVQYVPRQKIDQMTQANHQGVVAQVAAYQYAELADLFVAAKKRQETPFF